MTFIFWQNIISLHQAAFLKALAKRHEVILVAEQPLTRERAEEGWDLPDMGAVRTVTEPGTAQIVAAGLLAGITTPSLSGTL